MSQQGTGGARAVALQQGKPPRLLEIDLFGVAVCLLGDGPREMLLLSALALSACVRQPGGRDLEVEATVAHVQLQNMMHGNAGARFAADAEAAAAAIGAAAACGGTALTALMATAQQRAAALTTSLFTRGTMAVVGLVDLVLAGRAGGRGRSRSFSAQRRSRPWQAGSPLPSSNSTSRAAGATSTGTSRWGSRR
mmetsp:Transcript_20555/g.48677  ORF Transcript_20555/g.48677 Transcript_20555/m.48677 type:complete len:194 (+) Transcript_20555:3-584(+)